MISNRGTHYVVPEFHMIVEDDSDWKSLSCINTLTFQYFDKGLEFTIL